MGDSIATVLRFALAINRVNLVRLNLLWQTTRPDELWPIRWKVDLPIPSSNQTLFFQVVNAGNANPSYHLQFDDE